MKTHNLYRMSDIKTIKGNCLPFPSLCERGWFCWELWWMA